MTQKQIFKTKKLLLNTAALLYLEGVAKFSGTMLNNQIKYRMPVGFQP